MILNIRSNVSNEQELSNINNEYNYVLNRVNQIERNLNFFSHNQIIVNII